MWSASVNVHASALVRSEALHAFVRIVFGHCDSLDGSTFGLNAEKDTLSIYTHWFTTCLQNHEYGLCLHIHGSDTDTTKLLSVAHNVIDLDFSQIHRAPDVIRTMLTDKRRSWHGCNTGVAEHDTDDRRIWHGQHECNADMTRTWHGQHEWNTDMARTGVIRTW